MKYLFAVIAAAGLTSGCASITGSEMQSVSVTTHTESGSSVDKAKCTLRNDKGSWETTTPAFVGVRRSSEDLTVECSREGHPPGLLRAISRAAGGMFGNIIFGGGIGAIIDHNKGTGYDYPDVLKVVFGKSTNIDRQEQNASTPQAAPGAGEKPR